MDHITQFLNDPLVAPLWAFLVLSLCVCALTVWRAIGTHTFDIEKLPNILSTTVLQTFVPLAILGVASLSVTDGLIKDGLITAYSAGIAAAAASELRQLLDAINPPKELTIGDSAPPTATTPKPSPTTPVVPGPTSTKNP
jgi:hypothetical protein